jgi:hypothetical protein
MSWIWQTLSPDGRLIETSAQHATYGRALHDATEYGFNPAGDDYSVDLPHGRIDFAKGRKPKFSAERLLEVRPGPADVPKNWDLR